MHRSVTIATSVANPQVLEGVDAATLHLIRNDHAALAIWRRSPPLELVDWLDGLEDDRLPEGHFIGPAACVPARVSTLCDLVEVEDSPGRRAFIADVAQLARAFASVAGASDVDLRLEAVDHDSCWRFHRDHVGYRLNATYRGPGTQWLAPELAGRALRAQRRYRGPLHELPRFAAGLFKGVKRAGDKAVVHRSPPVAGSGQTRVFLCLNEVSDHD